MDHECLNFLITATWVPTRIPVLMFKFLFYCIGTSKNFCFFLAQIGIKKKSSIMVHDYLNLDPNDRWKKCSCVP